MANPVVGIIMGSKSDLDVMSEAAKVLDDLGVASEVRVLSAHRTPEETTNYVKEAANRGLKVIIAGAGGSAHLAGVTAAHTTLPVISIPIRRQGQGQEALLSNIAMPPGIPLATMPENGAKNAALLAAAILSLVDDSIAKRYEVYRRQATEEVKRSDKKLQQLGWAEFLKEK
ncbi:TPA: 5-(carboxyamino)imidazole ribonucleotide mutase [Candidatus Saccharibacteria bacterium]|nr:MAG: 5-(carboxyamino)imidazole ribonucleotide mutase [Candidatus Saccharibacteria bacterium RIFCSPHIGHO2_12_FULL_47_17]HCM52317.1 5-(carboxyamino)imidazole ribonucleotide mutase [Candidatus Saccharibacteria bacterium]